MSAVILLDVKDKEGNPIEIEIPIEIAKMSNLLATMLEQAGEVSGIKLPIFGIPKEIFAIVIEFLEKCNTSPIIIPEQLVSADMKENLLNNPSVAEFMDQWDGVVDKLELMKIITGLLNASGYLDIDNLRDLCCIKIACLLKKDYRKAIYLGKSFVNDPHAKIILDYLDFVDLQNLPRLIDNYHERLRTNYYIQRQKFMNYELKREIHVDSGESRAVVSCSPDGKLIGFANRIYKENGEIDKEIVEEKFIRTPSNIIRCSRFSGDGNFYALLCANYLWIYDVRNNFAKIYEKEVDGFVNTIELSYNGEIAALFGVKLQVIRLVDNTIILDLSAEVFLKGNLSKNGKYVGYIANSRDRSGYNYGIIDLSSGNKEVFNVTVPGFPYEIAFSDDCQYFAVACPIKSQLMEVRGNLQRKELSALSIYRIRSEEKEPIFYKEEEEFHGQFEEKIGKNMKFSKSGLFLIHGQDSMKILDLVKKDQIELEKSVIADICISSNDMIVSKNIVTHTLQIWKEKMISKDGGNRKKKLIKSFGKKKNRERSFVKKKMNKSRSFVKKKNNQRSFVKKKNNQRSLGKKRNNQRSLGKKRNNQRSLGKKRRSLKKNGNFHC